MARILVYSAEPYDVEFLSAANADVGHDLEFREARLDEATAALADGFPVVCLFVNDDASAPVLERLARTGVRHVALRSAGYNNVDLEAARKLGIEVTRVPAYSPNAVAEHTVALILSLARRLHRAYTRVRDGNFSLEGLLGFNLDGKTVGILGTGRIGTVTARILAGFGCRLLGHDPEPNEACRELGMRYVALEELLSVSDIVSIHCPLTPDTYHLIDHSTIALMKPGVVLVNTSRGRVLDTRAVIAGLKSERIGALGIDVYEEEEDVFFHDLSDKVIQDDTLSRLLTFPNVLVTGHQGFFTREAMTEIATVTLANVDDVERTGGSANSLDPS